MLSLYIYIYRNEIQSSIFLFSIRIYAINKIAFALLKKEKKKELRTFQQLLTQSLMEWRILFFGFLHFQKSLINKKRT